MHSSYCIVSRPVSLNDVLSNITQSSTHTIGVTLCTFITWMHQTGNPCCLLHTSISRDECTLVCDISLHLVCDGADIHNKLNNTVVSPVKIQISGDWAIKIPDSFLFLSFGVLSVNMGRTLVSFLKLCCFKKETW